MTSVTVMNDSGRSATGGRMHNRILATMIVSEIALAIVLVAGAGWLVRSFANQQQTDPGFSATGRLAVNVLVPFAKYNSPEKVGVWSRDVTDVELSGMVASIDHLAYHLGAIRQINKDARGPKEGTF